MADVVEEPVSRRLFTGEVTRQVLAHDSNDFSMSLINFGEGVRNKFHTHECDQILIVTDGEGMVVTDEHTAAVRVGDVILSRAGEKHWHGAKEGSHFSHITITRVPGLEPLS